MSDNLPVEIQMDIMNRLSVKQLLQCQLVSKAWKSMIVSSEFIARYRGQVQHLLVNHHDLYGDEPRFHNFISIVDDDTFPQQKVSLFVPDSVYMLESFRVIGCSHGLLCLDAFDSFPEECYPGACDDIQDEDNVAILWNISTRKTVAVVVPYAGNEYRNVIGFGVCPETNGPKIVNIKFSDNRGFPESTENVSFMPWQVEVFTLSTGTWRSVSNNLPRMSTELFGSQVVIDEFLYWLATDMSGNMIISFDITREEFREVKLPDSLAHDRSHESLYISTLNKSLVVLERVGVEDNPSFIVWMMNDGISKSFTKLYTIHIPDVKISNVLEFRKNHDPILELSEYREEDRGDHSTLVVYEPYTKRTENIGIDDTDELFYASSYVETLHLINQPNSVIYYNGKRLFLKLSNLEEL